MNSVIIIKKKSISLLDSKTNSIKWTIEESNTILGTYRLDGYVFLYTFNGWTTNYTSLIDLKTGKFHWRDKNLDIVSNCIAIDNKLFFVNKKFKIISIEIESGNEIFEEKFPYKKWYSSVYPQLVVYDGKILAYTKKNIVKVDMHTGKLIDFNFRNIDLKDIELMNDKFNISVNRYNSSGSGGDAFVYGAYAGDAGGFGGDAGGGGGGDGGGG